MSKPKIFIAFSVIDLLKICPKYLDSLRERFDVSVAHKADLSKNELHSLVKGAHAIIAYSVDFMDGELIKAAGGNLKVVSIPAAGYDKLDIHSIKKRGIRVGTAGSAITNGTAEMALTLLLAFSRNLVPICNAYKSNPQISFRGPRRIPAMGIEDAVIGIVGAGRIGQSIARKVKPFAVRRILYSSRTEKNEMKILDAELSSLEKLAAESDYLIIALALNEHTRRIINERIFNLMKPNAVIVNVGRGGLIDQDALIEALRSKKIGGAALDVTEPEPLPENHPLFILDNVLITPHVGGIVGPTFKNVVDLAFRNAFAALEDKEMPEEIKL